MSSHFLHLEDSMISLKPENPEELRKRLREMSDLELRCFGQRARQLSDPETASGRLSRTSENLKRRGRSGEEDTQNCTEPRVGKSHWAHGEIALPKKSQAISGFSARKFRHLDLFNIEHAL